MPQGNRLAVILRQSDHQRFISVRDLIINKQDQIMMYQKMISDYYSNNQKLKAEIAEDFLELLQYDLDEFKRIDNGM